MEMDSTKLSRYLYFNSSLAGRKLRIMCNHLEACGTIFFEGDDYDAGDIDWIADAVKHILEEH